MHYRPITRERTRGENSAVKYVVIFRVEHQGKR